MYFNPMYLYVKRIITFTLEDDAIKIFTSISLLGILKLTEEFFKVNYFGVTNGLLVWVIGTILIDAFFGTKKSLIESKMFLKQALLIKSNTAKKRMLLKKAELKKFNPLKLQFTFFKVLTLLAYLFFAKNILEQDAGEGTLLTIIGIASGVAIKAPIAIFWYYDFKSIGSNLEYLLGKKPPIFVVVEKIFEPKIFKFLNSDKTDLDNDN
jgi:hypothetical protein